MKKAYCLALAVFVALVFVLGFFAHEEAFAAQCVNRNSIKSCTSCFGNPCAANVNGDAKINVADLTLIQKCWKNPKCTNSPPSNLDVNHDGKCNQTDYDIVYRCSGCCASPSPFK